MQIRRATAALFVALTVVAGSASVAGAVERPRTAEVSGLDLGSGRITTLSGTDLGSGR